MAAGPMSWAADVSDAQFRGIGALELLGAAGLTLPGVLGIVGVLTPLAAVGLALAMVGAFFTHARFGETERLTAPSCSSRWRCSSRSSASARRASDPRPPGIDHHGDRPGAAW
jgi:DoxX-like family